MRFSSVGVLAQRDFRNLWAGETVSQFGNGVSQIAIPLVALDKLHASTFEVGALSAMSSAALVVAGLPAGVWVDRMSRRVIMVAAAIGMFILMGSIPLSASLGWLNFGQMCATMFGVGMLAILFDVAYQAVLPALLSEQELTQGNSLLVGGAAVAGVAGPSLGGTLVQIFGSTGAVAFDAATFLVSAASVASVGRLKKAADTVAGTSQRISADVREGLRYLGRHAVLRSLAITAGVANLFYGLSNAVTVVFLVRGLHAPAAAIGVLFGVGSIGGVAGAAIATRLERGLGTVRSAAAGLLVAGLGPVLLGCSVARAGLAIFAVGLVFLYLGLVSFNIGLISFRQRVCPDNLLGRVIASMRIVSWGVFPLGSLLGGALGEVFGTRATLLVGGIGVMAAGVWCLRLVGDEPGESTQPAAD